MSEPGNGFSEVPIRIPFFLTLFNSKHLNFPYLCIMFSYCLKNILFAVTCQQQPPWKLDIVSEILFAEINENNNFPYTKENWCSLHEVHHNELYLHVQKKFQLYNKQELSIRQGFRLFHRFLVTEICSCMHNFNQNFQVQ